ncbi:MAG: hypothetical protein ACPG19_10730, partial [Saprospiraceae bacterium]
MFTNILQQHFKKWSTVFLFFFVMGIMPLYGATITWTNGGGDNLWSNTANWSSAALPTTSDDVVFDGTSVDNTTLDIATAIKSLTIDAAYTGQVSLGSQTLAMRSNLTVDNASQLDAGTSTVSFFYTGTISCPANLYNIEISTAYGQATSISQELIISNDLLLTGVNNMSGDTIKVHGDIVSNTS